METKVKTQQQLLHIGQALKDKRKALNLSLKEVAQKTCISLTVLKAIEEGQMENLPVYVYLRGFILSYARVVGLKEQSLLKEIQMLLPQQETPAIKPAGGVSDLENMVETELHLMPIIVASVILLVLGGVLVFFNVIRSCDTQKSFIKNIKTKSSVSTTVDVPLEKVKKTDSVSLKTPSSTRSKQAPRVVVKKKPFSVPTVSLPVTSNLEIVVKALGEVQVFYQSDEGETQNIYLKKDHFEVLKAKDSLLIQTDKSNLVQIFQNGEDLGLLGEGEQTARLFKNKSKGDR